MLGIIRLASAASGLAALVSAGPLAAPASQSPKPTLAPTLAARQEAQITTIPVSSCYVYQDPHQGIDGCSCDGYSSLLPMTSDGSDFCGYTAITTATVSTTANGFPCTTTYSNEAIVAYAESTMYPGATDYYCVGDETTIQAGSSVSLQMNPTGSGSVNVGYATSEAERSALYTQISNSIVAACPSPTDGETVTACSDVPAVTDIAGVDVYGDLKLDNKIDITVVLVSYTDVAVRDLLAVSIAQGVAGAAAAPDNTAEVRYFWSKEYGDVSDGFYFANMTNVPELHQAIFTRQTADTDGAVEVQNLEVTFVLEAAHDSLTCGDAGLVLSGLAALGAVIPGMGWLSMGAVGSVSRFALGMGCNGADWSG